MKESKSVRVWEDDPVQFKTSTPLIGQAGPRPLAARTPHEVFDLGNDRRAIGSDARVYLTSVVAAHGGKTRDRRAGGKRLFGKPLDRRQILVQVDEVLKAAPKLEAGVLIVDGNLQVRTDLEQTALSAGFDVCSARDGVGALEILRTRKPPIDLLLVDMHADEPNGATLIGRALRINPALYVVMLSGDATRDEIRAGYAAGAVSLALKPIPAGRLQTFLKASLKAARIRQVRAREHREHRERNAAQPLLQRLVRRVTSCLRAPSHSRRSRMIGALALTGISLTIGAGMGFVLQTMNEKADRYEAKLDRAMQMLIPLQGPGGSKRDATPGGMGGTEQLRLMREANDVTRRYYEDHLQEMRWQNRDMPVEGTPVMLPEGRIPLKR